MWANSVWGLIGLAASAALTAAGLPAGVEGLRSALLAGSLLLLLAAMVVLIWPALRRKARSSVRVSTGPGPEFNLREPSSRGGIVHLARVKVENGPATLTTAARLLIINLTPVHAGQHSFLLRDNINLSAGEHVYVNVATHSEGVRQDASLISLQLPVHGGFYMRSGHGIITGEHRFDLRLAREDSTLAEIRCRLFVDDQGTMRLEQMGPPDDRPR